MTKAEKMARYLISTSNTQYLIQVWEETTENDDPHISMIRGWLMDEFRSRDRDNYEKWLMEDGEDENLKNYIVK